MLHTRKLKPVGQNLKWSLMTKRQTEAYARGEHVMSKPEASLMRRIQSETGMTEEEVRKHKKYRKMLSDAQKPANWKPAGWYAGNPLTTRAGLKNPLEEKWSWGSQKAMFMQKACEVLNGDKEAAARLYKRYAGGLIDDHRPNAFYYREFDNTQPETDILKAIDKTEGMFVFAPHRNEVGFMYETSLTMFSLCYQVK